VARENITAKYLEEFLYGENGFIIKYHSMEGLHPEQLDELYDMLEALKSDWKDKDAVPKNIMYQLIGLIPALYNDLHLYEDGVGRYPETIYQLETAIFMCLNPDPSDPHFNTPLREL
jgi:hypothetical protein